MRTFKNCCAQGDIYIRRIDALPEGAEVVPPENGKLIVTHSETGHHHVMEAEHVTMRRLPGNIMDILLEVEKATPLVHLRPHDTHDPIMLEPGKYHVRRQREYTPEGFRRVAD